MIKNINPAECEQCGNLVDEDGFSTTDACPWGPVSCDSCGYCYCDLSC